MLPLSKYVKFVLGSVVDKISLTFCNLAFKLSPLLMITEIKTAVVPPSNTSLSNLLIFVRFPEE